MLSTKLTPLILNNNTKLTDLLTLSKIDSKETEINYTEEEFKNLDSNELSKICSLLYSTDNLDYRIYILNNLYKFHKDLCNEHFHKLLVQYLYNPLIELNEQTLVKIIKESILPIDLKYECAKLIYNEYKERNKESNNNIYLGYELLIYILNKCNSEKLHRLIRLEILKILAETYEYKSQIELCILEYLSDKELYEYDRYRDMLNLAENPKTQSLYNNYIFEKICLSGVLSSRYVILGAQFVFNNKLFSIIEKNKIEKEIIRLCQDTMLDYYIRADACDFLIITQDVTDEGREIARNTIIELGRNNINNIYYDKQNVHDEHIDKSVKKIIEIIMNIEDKENNKLTYDDMCNKIILLFCKQNDIELTENNININNIEDKNETPVQYTTEDDYIITKEPIETVDENIIKLNSIKSSLARFQLDRSMYSNIPKTQTLFVNVWNIINEHEHKDELIKRLFEELIDMNGTCSTGHTSRLVNIFSGFKLNGELIKLNIDCKSEMISVTMSKINKRIQDLSISGKPEDEKYQNDLMEEMMWNSNLENRVNLNRFIRENIMSIREELYKEYVTEQNLINEETFEINFGLILHKFNY